MSWFENVSPKLPTSASAKPMFDSAAMAQLGALSPLWMLFFGASTAAMAYWGMTHWMRLATPERLAENVVKLRLVKPEPAPQPVAAQPAPVAEVQAAAPSIPEPMMEVAATEPVVAEVASVSVVMPEPAAEAAAVVAPDLVKVAPKPRTPRAIKPKPIAAAAAPSAATEPPVAPKVPARRGRPPKATALKVESPRVQVPKAAFAPTAAAKPKTPGAKRGPKPKAKT